MRKLLSEFTGGFTVYILFVFIAVALLWRFWPTMLALVFIILLFKLRVRYWFFGMILLIISGTALQWQWYRKTSRKVITPAAKQSHAYISPSPFENAMEGPYEVFRVVDASNIKVIFENNNIRNIRLIGIGADPTLSPSYEKDSKCLQLLGRDYLQRVIAGKKIYLQNDRYHKDKDELGRLLRYVYLSDGTMLNELMIKAGLAISEVSTEDSKYAYLFKNAESIAKANRLGVWSADSCRTSDVGTLEQQQTDND